MTPLCYNASMTLFSLDILSSRRKLSKAITLIESSDPKDRGDIQILLKAIPAPNRNSIRIGISGTPGVGKSTLIEALGQHWIIRKKSVAVLAIDPSSPKTRGSILGDKTRMQNLSLDPKAYVRPSPSLGYLGGIAPSTRNSMLLCEAAGFDVTIVETVGIGQSEAEVAQLVDVFVLLLQPGSGDELQSIKRGILELPDIICVNKCDGELEAAAKKTQRSFHSAPSSEGLSFPRKRESIRSISAITKDGIPELADEILSLHASKSKSGELEALRAEQDAYWKKRSKVLEFESEL